MTDDKKYELSRRKALLGLGTIGAAGAAAGLGTSALFTDTETFENNSITAGTLDMTVEATEVAISDNRPNSPYEVSGDTANAENAVSLSASDVKPGDWVIYCIDITIEDNPGYVTIHADNLDEEDVSSTEPEAEAEDVDVGNTSADLGEYLHVTHWGEFNGDIPPEESNVREDLNTLDNTTDETTGDGASPVQEDYSKPDTDGNATLNGTSVEYSNLREFVETYDTDDTNEDDESSGVLIGGDDPELIGGPGTDDYDTFTYYILIELPLDVGNQVQGDSVQFDLAWSTEQTRNNDDPRSPSPLI
jgi:predicted ribosomally synthesized peptide with SipW-like signal peptide